ncbi:phosphatidylinositol transfer protein CSR1 [Amylocarpus encephaloides]|uniref:Phosphatidylinositol transfer protein CSR1 n=1 Tax=Amylocarpus encephaloides TaxID=45428 RepID=A0A9P7Y9X0_9HELO|nr:phosphatidylinositol transfer protein CSR1 [Amylocarpus encephaloides]
MPQENQVGRVGHLTPEQEEKLKELWVLTLEVFGVLEKQQNGSADAEATSDTTDSKKPKKKRMTIFRRSQNDDADSIKSSKSGVKTPTGLEDDKYGQTKEFHDAIANQSPESLRATFWSMVKHDHPDALLLRFLRARKWDVGKALVMMISTMKWRAKDVHVDDDVMKNGELELVADSQGDDAAKRKLGEDFLAQMRMGKSFFHGLDREGRPVCIVRARLHRQGEQSEESLERYTVFTIETGRMILSPPTDTACVIFDLTGFSMANMDYTPVKFMIKCFEANYPESLGVVLVHKAPWIFQGIWKIIRGWLDPVVAAKVNFTNNEQELEAFIPRSNIIKELGGEEDWEYEYIEPSDTENSTMKDTASRDKLLLERETTVNAYEAATKEWINGANVKDIRNEIAATLRDGYWILDLYVRAKSYYDRVGLILNGGKINFYPTRAEASKETVPNGAPKPAETSEADLD